ncbi:hypothetical protein KUDE01_013501 [Dissostichus eleginoides]|uniref:Uncharacterized protein n=1 Tax=Dissostichus eleginoides TaxID=100907 RepID=A0AAD9BTU4_DISEL|nr:hypothetical protein KUDE01_013501 [Dissostichus eleginoides]
MVGSIYISLSRPVLTELATGSPRRQGILIPLWGRSSSLRDITPLKHILRQQIPVKMGEAELAEAFKLWDEKPDDLEEDEKEAILEPFKFCFEQIEDMWTFCNEIRDKRGYFAYCECI